MIGDAQIIALGARSPVGLRAESTAAAVRAGISRIAEHSKLIDGAGEPLRCASDALLPPSLFGVPRMVQMASSAIEETIEKLGTKRSAAKHVLLALPQLRPGFVQRDVDTLVRDIGRIEALRSASIDVVPVVGGHAAGIRALELAVARIAQRPDEVVLVGGVDSYLDAETLAWMESQGAVARKGVRGGFSPGEGAAFVAVASKSTCARLKIRPLGHVRSVVTGREPRSPDSEEGLLGEGLAEVIRRATHMVNDSDRLISDVYCDINGQRHRTDEWSFAILRSAAIFRDPAAYETSVGSCGDLGAASVALALILAVRAWSRRYAHGPTALIWGSSTEGLRGAVLLEQEGG